MDPSNTPEITPELLQQNPILLICMTLFGVFAITVISGSLTSWVFVGIRIWKKQPLLSPVAWSPLSWRPRVWGLVDIIACVFLLVILQRMLFAVGANALDVDIKLIQEGDPPPLSLAAILSSGYLLTVAFTGVWIVLRYRETFAHIGLTHKKTLRFLFIGLVTGLCTLPVVYALSALVTLGLEKKYEHPILDAMVQDGSLASYLLAAFAAVLAAPIAEEMFFRVFLQGWMQSIPLSSIGSIVLGASASRRNDPSDFTFFHPLPNSASGEPPLATSNPYEPYAVASEQVRMFDAPAAPASTPESDLALEVESASQESVLQAEQTTDAVSAPVPPIWPSVVTGILFGLAHWGYGFSFIPLIVFGIVLGLLYRSTQSVWPCILVHFMLNFSSIIALGINVLMRQAAGAE